MSRVHRVTTGGAVARRVSNFDQSDREPRYNTLANEDEAFDPRDQQISEILRTVDDNIEFGEPQNPNDPTSTALAGVIGVAGAHNGTKSNISGSWVEIELQSAAISNVTCTHNLFLHDPDYVVPVTGQPNCRWFMFGVMHDGTATDGTTSLRVEISFIGGTVTANAIDLQFSLIKAGNGTIGSSNRVLVTLFFIRATRGK